MSYCVNCGVELEKSEKICPLCGVPVINPAATGEEAPILTSNYPKRVERPRKSTLRKRLVVLLTALMLLIPIGICLFSDYEINGSLSWSLIVSGAEVVLFICIFSPLLFKKLRPLLCTLIDGAAVIALLYLVGYVIQGDWFLPLALPLSGAALLIAGLLVLLLVRPRKQIGALIKAGSILLSAGFYTLFVEWFLSLRYADLIFPRWSVYTSIPCVIIGLICFVVNALPEVKDQLKRRFFI